jgi:transposase
MFTAIDRGMNPGAVARTFAVSVSWIYKALARRHETGEAARRRCCDVAGKLDAHHEAIRARVAAVPDMTIGELRAWMLATYGVSVGHAAMWETDRSRAGGWQASRDAPAILSCSGMITI